MQLYTLTCALFDIRLVYSPVAIKAQAIAVSPFHIHIGIHTHMHINIYACMLLLSQPLRGNPLCAVMLHVKLIATHLFIQI